MFKDNHLYLNVNTNQILFYSGFYNDMYFFEDIVTGQMYTYFKEELINEHVILKEY